MRDRCRVHIVDDDMLEEGHDFVLIRTDGDGLLLAITRRGTTDPDVLTDALCVVDEVTGRRCQSARRSLRLAS